MAENTFVDLSGVASSDANADPNPYVALIKAANNDSAEIQARYRTHRTTREGQQRDKLLSPDFPGVTIDAILKGLEERQHEGFVDWRWCMVFWARPTAGVKSLVSKLQHGLREAAPNLWLMPSDNLHMTALELAHSKTKEEIEALVEQALPLMERITDLPATSGHRARLLYPQVTYDASAIALSYLPATGEGMLPEGRTADEDAYSYHHLRRDIWQICTDDGIEVGSRYVVPSAHLTIGRFIVKEDFEDADGKVDHEKVERLVTKIEGMNQWLREEFWPGEMGAEGEFRDGGEWVVGQEKGLDCRWGTLWYGGGQTVRLGKGF